MTPPSGVPPTHTPIGDDRLAMWRKSTTAGVVANRLERSSPQQAAELEPLIRHVLEDDALGLTLVVEVLGRLGPARTPPSRWRPSGATLSGSSAERGRRCTCSTAVAEMMTAPERPGGLVVQYVIPPEELPELASLLRRGRDWARQNGIALSPRLAARVADIDAGAAVLVRKATAVNGNPNLSPTQDIAASGNGQNVHYEKIGDVVFLSGTVSGLTGLSVRRVRQLAAAGSIPARRTSAGWLFDREDVKRFIAGREAQ